ncbi:structural maintenance of chromosomes protein 2-1 [Tanacetum coccineum]
MQVSVRACECSLTSNFDIDNSDPAAGDRVHLRLFAVVGLCALLGAVECRISVVLFDDVDSVRARKPLPVISVRSCVSRYSVFLVFGTHVSVSLRIITLCVWAMLVEDVGSDVGAQMMLVSSCYWVAFNRQVKTRSVTFEGDLFHLSGLVTGGSARQLHAVGEAYSELFLHEKRLAEIEAKINALVPLHEKYNELKQQLEVKAFRLKQSQNTAEQNEHHKLEEAKSALTEKHAFYEESVTKVANLVISVQNHANNKDGSLKTRAEKIEAVKKKMQSAKKNLKNEISTLTSEVDLLKIKVKCTEVEQKNCSLKVDKLINKHAWITSEKQFFGRSGKTLCEEVEEMGFSENVHEKRVNKKVMSMFEKTENDYNDLISKKNIIETDKSKIKLVIEEVDAKKKEILQATWVKGE